MSVNPPIPKERRRIIFLFAAVLCALLCSVVVVKAQVRYVHEFHQDLSKAFVLAMASDADTLVVSDIGKAWMLGPMRFEGARNKTVVFEPGVKIEAIPAAFPRPTQAFFGFFNCQNITLLGSGTAIRMRKEEYTKGEWRHIFLIRGCNGFRADGFALSDSGGDGIEISGNTRVPYSEDVVITNCSSVNNRRQGISIISGKEVYIRNCIFSETKGTMPGAGADLEPNKPEDILDGIYFENCHFENNFNSGIKLALHELTAASRPVNIRFSGCVLSNNFHPDNPRVPAEITLLSSPLDGVKGKVVFEDCVVENNSNMAVYARKDGDAYQVEFRNFLVRKSRLKPEKPLIYLEVPDYRQECTAGGFLFSSFYVDDTLPNDPIVVRGSRMGSLKALLNIKGIITLRGIQNPGIRYINYDPELNRGVDLRIVTRN